MLGPRKAVRWLSVAAFAAVIIYSFGAAAEFTRQPATWSSSLCASSGPDIYDWQLATMISTWIARPGFANMVLVFGECYGGGMLDELQTMLEGKGDVALASAARHDELSWALNANGLAASRNYWARLGYDRPITFFNKELVEELARLRTALVPMERAVERAAGADPVREDGTNPAGCDTEDGAVSFGLGEFAGDGYFGMSFPSPF